MTVWPLLVALSSFALGGQPARVECSTVETWPNDPGRIAIVQRYGFEPAAYALISERRVVLGWWACGGTVLLGADPDDHTHLADADDLIYREAASLFVVLHELGHLAQGPDEHGADCFALAHYDAALAWLHVPAERMPELHTYAQSVHDRSPPPYSGPCP